MAKIPVKFMLWNLNKKPLQALLAGFCSEHSIDVLILAECTIPLPDLLQTINLNQTATYTLAFEPQQRTEGLILLTRLPNECIVPVRDEGRFTIKKLIPPIGQEVLLVAAHLPSKLHAGSNEQALLSTRYAKLIQDAEHAAGHARTILVGDLNMNPFEDGIVGAEAFHAVMTRRVAQRSSRLVNGQERLFFYNPMWSHLGERSGKPGGTYFYDSGSQVNYYWNVFDQVLVRPELLPSFRDEDLTIITSIRGTNLLKPNGTPNAETASDHLPIIFTLLL
jgi:hypothetical protein